MKGLLPSIVAAVFTMCLATDAGAQARKLSDADLDKVTAGNASTEQQSVPPKVQTLPLEFSFAGRAGTRHTVEGAGTVQVAEQESGIKGTLIVRDQAQQNLQSFVNVTAVNSKVQVLINLNISINSTVGAVQQVNLSDALGGP